MDQTTAALASRLGIQPQSIRAAVCRNGSYYGITPTARLPNGRLLWPGDAFQRILEVKERK
ncbi:MAG: hypothetical protein Q7V19_08095 [Bacteroidales bacterium]|nr:hypothetical protein [Bacteroidales bacterium]MDP2196831.1 DNA-binding protein [Rhodocyclaceae bacterium]